MRHHELGNCLGPYVLTELVSVDPMPPAKPQPRLLNADGTAWGAEEILRRTLRSEKAGDRLHGLYMLQRLKNIGLVTGPGGSFATRLVTESEVLRQTPSATSLLKTTVLHTEACDKDL